MRHSFEIEEKASGSFFTKSTDIEVGTKLLFIYSKDYLKIGTVVGETKCFWRIKYGETDKYSFKIPKNGYSYVILS